MQRYYSLLTAVLFTCILTDLITHTTVLVVQQGHTALDNAKERHYEDKSSEIIKYLEAKEAGK